MPTSNVSIGIKEHQGGKYFYEAKKKNLAYKKMIWIQIISPTYKLVLMRNVKI